jgi:hypothetical protein
MNKAIAIVKLVLVAGTGLLLVSMGACVSSMNRICNSEVPLFERKMEVANVLILKQLDENHPERALASETSSELNSKLSSAQIKAWEEWSLARLKTLQSQLDRVKTIPNLEKAAFEIHSAANSMVVFSGYATNGNLVGMQKSLSKIQTHSDKIRTLACSASNQVK